MGLWGGQGQLEQLPRMAASHWPSSVSPRVCSRGQERRSAPQTEGPGEEHALEGTPVAPALPSDKCVCLSVPVTPASWRQVAEGTRRSYVPNCPPKIL